MIAVSSCLLGFCVRYDGKHQLYTPLKQLYDAGKVISICPEVFGGLPTPRTPAEIMGGNGNDVLLGQAKVIDSESVDLTEAFIEGAKIALKKIQDLNIHFVVLKANSPSCGSQQIYSGEFNGSLKDGMGVCAALFRQNGIQILDENSPNLIEVVNALFDQENVKTEVDNL
ncbi:TPA: DUF523 domain-containing protein [Providencia rettgeri]|uniref:DUF523 domain-containing protein n=1 Tax=Providencia sp. PROV129 TaxID=2949839 RepID=UPI00234B9332|nr:DUF523 domain-containing protein [Providencia rettgeri]